MTRMNLRGTKLLYIILLTSLFSSCDSCETMGAYELGNNLVLLEGDKLSDRIIVNCSGRSYGCCQGGSFIVPRSYEDKRNHYVETAKSNDQWIVAKSIQSTNNEKLQHYWIIDKQFNLDNVDCSSVRCDSIIQTYVTGPLVYEDFQEQVERLSINLKIE